MKQPLGMICALFMGAAAAPAMADGPVVVELFTSQGCNACPPADDFLGELAAREDVIALALHVDYWDYIGWADTFGNPAFSDRQHGYGRAAGSTVVYTPQMIVGGVDHVVGFQPMEVADLITAHRAAANMVTVDATPSDGGWQVRAAWMSDESAPDMVVQVVTYSPMEEVEITRGENAGLTAEYYNIVRTWQVVSEWSGASEFQAQVMPANDMEHLIIVQSSGHGAIMGTARLD